ncbi:chaplin family protein [Actinomadura chokoriensis]|uniref:Chaplin n=1 Tax=Actinomadura chokoriensis TaxID=454156 RepID=A0ABV4QUT0_9ACTN
MSTSRAALVAAGALAMGAAFGPTANAGGWDGGHHDGGVKMESSGNFGVLNGNQVYAPISIPVDVCGNAVAIAGLSRAQCKGGATVSSHRSKDGDDGGKGYRAAGGHAAVQGHRAVGGWDGGHGGGQGHGKGVDMKTSGNFGIANGNQVYAPISIPVDVCGNAVAVLGAAQAKCKGGASVKRMAERKVDMQSSGNFGLLNGNQVFLPISIPVNVCGNAVAVLGLAQAQCKGGASVGDGHEHGHHHKHPHKPWRPPVKKHKKPYKPSKHRPAAKHEKLPSTMRGDAHRVANTGANYRRADGLPGVQGLLDSLRRLAKVPGMDAQPGQVGPQLPGAGSGAPVRIGSPVLS